MKIKPVSPVINNLIEAIDQEDVDLVLTKEGLPVQRQIVATTNVDDFAERLRRLQQSERYKQLVARREAPPIEALKNSEQQAKYSPTEALAMLA
jgi:hypothetical protein